MLPSVTVFMNKLSENHLLFVEYVAKKQFTIFEFNTEQMKQYLAYTVCHKIYVTQRVPNFLNGGLESRK